MRYRRDVDGLRAIAVVPVVLFHLGMPGFRGGFVGVDVFFVVSGFLITTLLMGEMNDFSLARFYDRRVRRIFPALFAMIAATSIAVLALSFPGDVRAMGKQILAATLFGANLLFYRESGYFDAAAHDKPLLHTWSLSVEEQYYLLFPPLLWFLSRVLPRARTAIVAALFAASLGLAVWMVRSNPSGAFYLPHPRAWELLAGSLLALRPLPRVGRAVATVASVLGLGAILASVVLFDQTTPFPGLTAVPAVLGTVLVLAAGERDEIAPVQKVLGSAPMVGIGKLSYSLYLWHWPIIVLARGWLLRDLTMLEAVVVIAASSLVSYASYRFVEQPARLRRPRVRLSLAVAVSLLALFVGVGALLYKTSGFRGARDAESSTARDDYLPGVCLLEISQKFEAWNPERCTSSAPARDAPTVVLFGDSYAGHYAPGLRVIQEEVGFELVQLTKDSCSPLPTADDLTRECRGFVEGALAFIAEKRPRVVVLAARWTRYFDAARVRAEVSDVLRRLDDLGVRTLLIGESPVYSATGPQIRSRLEGRGLPAETFQPKNGFYMDAPLQAAADQRGATLFSPRAALCDGATCRIVDQGKLIHWDEGHLSTHGSEVLARAMRAQLETLLR